MAREIEFSGSIFERKKITGETTFVVRSDMVLPDYAAAQEYSQWLQQAAKEHFQAKGGVIVPAIGQKNVPIVG